MASVKDISTIPGELFANFRLPDPDGIGFALYTRM